MSQPFPTPDDHNAIRGLILAQLDAFAAGDAERAFSFASAGIRERFGDAATFVEMVRRHYPGVYRARGARFARLRPRRDGAGAITGAIQVVFLLSATGDDTNVATYHLSREEPGWGISGCEVAHWTSPGTD